MDHQIKIWKWLLVFTSILFLIIGSAKIIFDQEYWDGIIKIFIFITLVFGYFVLIINKKPNLEEQNIVNPSFYLGYIFLIIGGNGMENIELAIFGFVLFIFGLFYRGLDKKEINNR